MSEKITTGEKLHFIGFLAMWLLTIYAAAIGELGLAIVSHMFVDVYLAGMVMKKINNL